MKTFFATITILFTAVFAAAQAKSSTNDILLDIVQYIEDHTSYQYNGERLPYIEVRTPDELCRAVYDNETYETLKANDECNIAGYYDEHVKVIYVSSEPIIYMSDPDFHMTIIVHEMVHYMQDISGYFDEVQCRAELEKDAYMIQRKYIKDHGLNEENITDPLFAMMVSTCSPLNP